MKRTLLGAILCAPLMLAACGDDPADQVDEGKGAPRTDKQIVVEDGIKGEPDMVIDDKGNPILNDDGTPMLKGQKKGPDYRGEMLKSYQGVWAVEERDCDAGSGPTRIRIGPHNVVFYEAEAEVKKLEQVGAVTVADMEVNTKTSNAREQHRISMAADGVSLNYERGGRTLNYKQCVL